VFPNPQDALPLPARPSLEQYRKLAKELVAASRSSDPGAVAAWSRRWIERLAETQPPPGQRPFRREHIEDTIYEVEQYVRRKLAPEPGREAGTLADAQHVLARSHGFDNWAELARHFEALAARGTEVSDFETAADAIVSGDIDTLRRLLRDNPTLVRARSTREHNGTLLTYVSANGVEGYRQRTPKNIVAITQLLLEAGAEVDAEADVYGGGCTPLGLTATSAHPRGAGVQLELMQLLLDHGARIEDPPTAGNRHSAVMSCIANGCPEAAGYFADRGARLDLECAAAIGRLAAVQSYFDAGGTLTNGATSEQRNAALRWAAAGGYDDVVEYLLAHGADIAAGDGDKQTPLHWAVMCASVDTMKLLIARGAPLEAHNVYGGTPFGQALWCAAHNHNADDFIPVVETLVAAGARFGDRHPPTNDRMDALLERHGSATDWSWAWFGERPRLKPGNR